MTIHVLHAGDGYTYLTRSVASGDEVLKAGTSLTDYYLMNGNPPGQWAGRGAAQLGVHGTVQEHQMQALFGEGRHPDADRIEAEALRAGATPDEALKASRLGRRFPQYKQRTDIRSALAAAYRQAQEAVGRPLTPDEAAAVRQQTMVTAYRQQHGRDPETPEQLGKFEAQMMHRNRDAVAGYDFVFTPVKSVAVLWGIGSEATRQEIYAAHQAAVDDVMNTIETNASFTRSGDSGQAQLDTNGIIGARFNHWDSRAGDPDLHTHVAVSNKVQGPDGKWRSLDGRALFAAAVSMSERYNTRIEDELRRRLGVEFVERPDGGLDERRAIREIDGVPVELIRGFSKRRHGIEQIYEQLRQEYRDDHGREPDQVTRRRLYQQATLTERPDKEAGQPLADLIQGWRAEADRIMGQSGAAERAEAAALGHGRTGGTGFEPDGVPAHDPADDTARIAELAASVVRTVQASRSTWTVHNIRAEAERQSRPLVTADRDRLVAAITERATGVDHSLRIEAPRMVEEPEPLLRRDGTSVFVPHESIRYTSTAVLDAEARIIHAAQTGDSAALPRPFVDRHIAASSKKLNPQQAELVHAFAESGRQVMLGLAPAGTGKTTAMRVVADAWTASGRTVIAAAPSAVAADVLAAELGAEAMTLALLDLTMASEPLTPGTMIVVDEAGMAGTLMLDRIISQAAATGAVVRLLGDDRQLAAIEAGGVIRQLANDVGAVRMHEVVRFTDPAEATATIAVREGDLSALDFYEARQRIVEGESDDVVDRAYQGWLADIHDGYDALLIAADGDQVTDLNARARGDLISEGRVAVDGIRLRDGTAAGLGDHIATRHNDRLLQVNGGRDFVKNGDSWRVTAVHPDGALTVTHRGHSGQTTLPADYVAEHVELDYARTVHRAQGMTVDRTHLIVDPGMSREALYVGLSRGRQTNIIYVPTLEDHGVRHQPDQHGPGIDVLAGVLRRSSAERSATDTIREVFTEAASLRRMASEYGYAAGLNAGPRLATIAEAIHPGICDDPAWPTLAGRLRQAQADGHNPERLLWTAENVREFDTAHSDTQVMIWRVDQLLADHTTRPGTRRQTPAPDVPRWLATSPDRLGTDPIPADYLRVRWQEISGRLTQLVQTARADQPAWLGQIPDPDSDVGRVAVRQIVAYRQVYDVHTDTPLGAPPAPRDGARYLAWREATQSLQDATRRPQQDPATANAIALRDELDQARTDRDDITDNPPGRGHTDHGPRRGI